MCVFLGSFKLESNMILRHSNLSCVYGVVRKIMFHKRGKGEGGGRGRGRKGKLNISCSWWGRVTYLKGNSLLIRLLLVVLNVDGYQAFVEEPHIHHDTGVVAQNHQVSAVDHAEIVDNFQIAKILFEILFNHFHHVFARELVDDSIRLDGEVKQHGVDCHFTIATLVLA